MNEQMGQEILQRIDVLAAKLGVAAEYLWDVLIRQMWLVEGWMCVGLGVALLLVGAVGCMRLYLLGGPDTSTGEWTQKDSRFTVNVVFAIVGILGGTFVLPDAVAKVLNPAYYAFKALIGG